jgi:hypothetical protein
MTGPKAVHVVLVMPKLHILLLLYQQATVVNAQTLSSGKIKWIHKTSFLCKQSSAGQRESAQIKTLDVTFNCLVRAILTFLIIYCILIILPSTQYGLWYYGLFSVSFYSSSSSLPPPLKKAQRGPRLPLCGGF